MTNLDELYLEVLKDNGKRSMFYDAFLSTILFMPTHTFLEKNGMRRRSDEDESISPMFFKVEKIKYLPLFDSEEKLYLWAKQEVNSIGLQGYIIVEMMDLESHWVLNSGTDYAKVFVPDEIKWLKQKVSGSQGKDLIVPEGTQITVSAPTEDLTNLIELLIDIFIQYNEVKSAHLGLVHYMIEGEQGHLMLIVEADCLEPMILEDIKKNISLRLTTFLENAECIDTVINSDSAVSKEIAKTVEPFYVAKLKRRS